MDVRDPTPPDQPPFDSEPAPAVLPYFSPRPESAPRPPVDDVVLGAVVCGLMVFVPVVPGLMAIAFALAVPRRPGGRTPARAAATVVGLGGGVLNLAIWLVLLVWESAS